MKMYNYSFLENVDNFFWKFSILDLSDPSMLWCGMLNIMMLALLFTILRRHSRSVPLTSYIVNNYRGVHVTNLIWISLRAFRGRKNVIVYGTTSFFFHIIIHEIRHFRGKNDEKPKIE